MIFCSISSPPADHEGGAICCRKIHTSKVRHRFVRAGTNLACHVESRLILPAVPRDSCGDGSDRKRFLTMADDHDVERSVSALEIMARNVAEEHDKERQSGGAKDGTKDGVRSRQTEDLWQAEAKSRALPLDLRLERLREIERKSPKVLFKDTDRPFFGEAFLDIAIGVGSVAAFYFLCRGRSVEEWAMGAGFLMAWTSIYIVVRSRFETRHRMGVKVFLKSLISSVGLLVFLSLIYLFLGSGGLKIAILGIGVMAIGFLMVGILRYRHSVSERAGKPR